jgi:hypothetical protein
MCRDKNDQVRFDFYRTRTESIPVTVRN